MVKKRETVIAQTLEGKIIGLYSLGTRLRDISALIKETYDKGISATMVRAIMDKVISLVKEWQQRSLEDLYCVVYLDAMFYKVKEEGRIVTRCMYNVLGINKDGKKDMLDMYISQSEGANFWLGVINECNQNNLNTVPLQVRYHKNIQLN